MRPDREEVFEYICENGRVSASGIAERFGVTVGVASGLLQKLRLEGKVVHIKGRNPLWEKNPRFWQLGRGGYR